MDIEILNLFPATIVVSIERENEFEQYVRTSQAGTRERTWQDDWEDDAKNCISKNIGTLETFDVTPSQMVFY